MGSEQGWEVCISTRFRFGWQQRERDRSLRMRIVLSRLFAGVRLAHVDRGSLDADGTVRCSGREGLSAAMQARARRADAASPPAQARRWGSDMRHCVRRAQSRSTCATTAATRWSSSMTSAAWCAMKRLSQRIQFCRVLNTQHGMTSVEP